MGYHKYLPCKWPGLRRSMHRSGCLKYIVLLSTSLVYISSFTFWVHVSWKMQPACSRCRGRLAACIVLALV
ncbi:hypothetical protein ASPFODRAFT_561307 [Aspergillus luchuensis CBS 106.47]|uniref:Uncharacterized protein n=1 Tax=Aspergillus luchuensis (strain CBS 106.47) TaxID=1137211 RepID=A0A1M3TK85_ASPLC|nr:hypothetical protein ASPFODRAFT_561307 [Aspergillus luchuensis CBS 106.47]